MPFNFIPDPDLTDAEKMQLVKIQIDEAALVLASYRQKTDPSGNFDHIYSESCSLVECTYARHAEPIDIFVTDERLTRIRPNDYA
jgi:hypothetical protein